MNRSRQVGRVRVVGDDRDPLRIAEFSVGQSAAGRSPTRAATFAPFVIAAWIAGICEAGVAAVPLVSVPVSLSAFSAAIAPPDLALSAVVKYELPRFFGNHEDLQAGLELGCAGRGADRAEDRGECRDHDNGQTKGSAATSAKPRDEWLHRVLLPCAGN